MVYDLVMGAWEASSPRETAPNGLEEKLRQALRALPTVSEEVPTSPGNS